LLAVLLIIVSFYLVFTQNSYQRSVYLSSANRVSAELYRLSGKVNSYFYMQKNNNELLEQNAKLQNELYALKSYLNDLALDSIQTNSFVSDSMVTAQFRFIPSNVVNISFFGSNNYITLDKGLQDGVKADMGVVSQNGGSEQKSKSKKGRKNVPALQKFIHPRFSYFSLKNKLMGVPVKFQFFLI
jgi:rod shape-determining protein MreC